MIGELTAQFHRELTFEKFYVCVFLLHSWRRGAQFDRELTFEKFC